MNDYSEDTLIEQPAIALLQSLDWHFANCYNETFGPGGMLGREITNEVVLLSRLRPALERLNPDIPNPVLDAAIEELIRGRSTLSLVEANRQVYQLLKEGVKVSYRIEDGDECIETVRLIDWDTPAHNDFFLASQFWVTGEIYKRRADLIGFVNGIPLVFIELKAAQKALKNAFDHNLKDYKAAIPQLFWYNALIILSNGSESRVGSLTAAWEHFSEWKKINSEGEKGVISLETMLRGVCQPERLLDLVENFILYQEAPGGLRKLIAKNHQYLGVNNAIQAVLDIKDNQGKLGVFWHTQGSGKSFSMVFFSQKVLRKLPGNWTFVIITDRKELDEQIYDNFQECGAVTEPQGRVRAVSGEHLQQILQEDHRFVFTLIQKFHIERGQTYPQLSARSDVIVMTDEAHRSQYDVLALNMRNALPKAAFIGFTGTPLMAGEELTRKVFGDYVSIYNFKQSVDDRATVPLYYENRIPELQLTDPDLNRDMEDLLDQAELDEDQQARLEREFSHQYLLITRNDRLEKVAEDIVQQFLGRGYQGKAMVVSIDKATAVKMYDKVKKYWAIQLAFLQGEVHENHSDEEWQAIQQRIAYMQETDIAVVVSQGQNEIEEMRAKGVEILPHRIRMVNEDLATRFKDPHDPFRLVFVCAMWMTGFDVPSCSTIYLDKPMRNHTLMQTIARANRVFQEKVNGLIVDYIGVFRNLQQALAIYGSVLGGELAEGEMPVKDKQALVEMLRKAIATTKEYLANLGVDLHKIQRAEGFERVALLDEAMVILKGTDVDTALEDAAEEVLVNDGTKRQYLLLASNVDRLFQAMLPDPAVNEFGMDRKAIVVLAEKLRSLIPPADIAEIMEQVEELLDEHIKPKDQGYIIRGSPGKPIAENGQNGNSHWVDLSQIDFEALKKKFEKAHKRIEIEKLRGMINGKLRKMIRFNHTRMDYYAQFQRMIEEYNSGAKNLDAFFAELVNFAQALNAEEKRALGEQLTEEQLAVFDILTKPDLPLSKADRDKVREVAQNLLNSLKTDKLVLDWRKNQQTRAAVRLTIEEKLDQLPPVYEIPLYGQKCREVYQHVYDSYFGESRSIYSMAN